MYQRLYRFLEACESLFNLQFGFRSGHSNDHALVSLTDNTKSSLDKIIDLGVEFLLISKKLSILLTMIFY